MKKTKLILSFSKLSDQTSSTSKFFQINNFKIKMTIFAKISIAGLTMTKLLLFVFTFSLIGHVMAEQKEISTISFGPVVLAENRLPITPDDLRVKADIEEVEYKIGFLPKSLQWIRIDKALLMPRIEMRLLLQTSPTNVTARYKGKSILFQSIKGKAFAQFYISLFMTDAVEIFLLGKKIGTINVELIKKPGYRKGHLIDYSCAPFNLDIQGIDDEYFSAGCNLTRKGSVGSETGILEVQWTMPNYRLLDSSTPPYMANIRKNFPVLTKIQNRHTGEIKEIILIARVPERLHRLNTALGFGPYEFETQTSTSSSGKGWTSPLFLYGNLYFDDTSSLRFFNAFVWRESYFNNFGLYYAYDMGSAFDNRIKIIPLLGFQAINFYHKPDGTKLKSWILPQGFEATYNHAFGMKNYSLAYGMFLSPVSGEHYNNMWIRFGRKIFGELNYLSYKEGKQYARTWGFSVGVPFVSFF